MSKHYNILDWPAPPSDIIEKIKELCISTKDVRGKTQGAYKLNAFNFPYEIEMWFRDNLPITDEYYVGAQNFADLLHVTKHVDELRDECINFLLTESGPWTSWYGPNDEVLETVVFPANKWHVIDAKTPHDVKYDKPGSRVSITMFIRNNRPAPEKFDEMMTSNLKLRKTLKGK